MPRLSVFRFMRWAFLFAVALCLPLLLAGCLLFPNSPPEAIAGADRRTGEAPLAVQFDGSASADHDGIVTTHQWTFGDGTTGTGASPRHVYRVPGTYVAVLTVLDEQGASSTAELEISVAVANAAPIVSFSHAPTTPIPGEVVRFDATATYDPDGAVTSYAWDFADGGTADGMTAEHVFATPGTYTVTLIACDNQGHSARNSYEITVPRVGTPPVAVLSVSPASPAAGDPVRVDASGSHDPDGVLREYVWEFGDGTSASGATALHAYAAEGTYTVVLRVTDDDGLPCIATQDVVVGSPPSGDDHATIHRSYRWIYNGAEHSAILKIPASIYTYCQAQPRDVWPYRDYDAYVLDTLDDALMIDLAGQLSEGEYHATAENALAFVQTVIEYQSDPMSFEYPRYPAETLVDTAGDCEDTAILYASLIRTLGRGALLVGVDTDKDGTSDHMVVFVPVSQAYCDGFPCGSRSFWMLDGQMYAFAETAMSHGTLPLGVDPWGLTPKEIHHTWNVKGLKVHASWARRP